MRRGRHVPWLVVAACSGDDVVSPDAPMGDPNVRVGVFEVELTAPTGADPGRTSVLGTIHDAAQPDTVVWELAAEDGGCRLLTPRLPFCATPCGAAAACVEDGVCHPYATKQSVGDVEVTGVGDAAFTMEPILDNYQPPAGTAIGYPPFAAGAAVRFVAAGSAWNGPFAIDGVGVDPLTLSSPDPTLERGEAVALAWTAGTVSAATIGVKLDISHHGGTRGKIECRGADGGALSIGGALITGLLDLGASGFPTIVVERTAIGSAVIGAGRVDLEVRSQVERPVVVPGVQSCTSDKDCTPPETCRGDLTCG